MYPLLAVVESLAQRAELDYAWLGSERAESRLVPQFTADSGIPLEFRQIDIRFSWRLPTPRNWGYYRRHLLPLALGRPFRQALAQLDELQPAALLASGGYVSAPAIWAALQRGVPVALLQIDAVVGLVNAQFCPRATRIYAATDVIAQRFAGRCAAGKLRVVGFPARQARRSRAEVCAELGLDPQRRLLVVMGGSLGAGAVLRCAVELVQAVERIPQARQLAVVLIVGERTALAEQLAGLDDSSTARLVQCKVVDYVKDSPSLMHAADFYFGRAGSSSVAELVDCGAQALLLPDPQHADRHQFANARLLAERGQAEVLDQRHCSGAAAAQWFERVWDRPRLPSPSPRAADVLAADLLELLEARR